MNLPNFPAISGSQELSGRFSAEEKVISIREKIVLQGFDLQFRKLSAGLAFALNN